MTTSKINRIIFHFTGSLLFLLLPIVFSPDFNSSFDLLLTHPFRRDFINNILLLIFFYCNYYLLIPDLFFKKKYILYAGATLIFYLIITLLPQFIIGPPQQAFRPDIPMNMPPLLGYSPPPKPLFPNYFFSETIPDFFQFLVVLIFSLMLRFNALLKRTEKEKTMAELAYLKAQINPHFLFNSLNSIYALALEKSDLTATAVVKLSGIMRYIINEATTDFVPLKKEIDYIRDYIDLQKFRFENTVDISFNITGNLKHQTIAPLLLIPFVENAFKHGISPEEASVIEINIDIKNNSLSMKIYNKKLSVKTADESQSKLGIKNTRMRLENLYAGQHSLKITEDASTYISELKIELK